MTNGCQFLFLFIGNSLEVAFCWKDQGYTIESLLLKRTVRSLEGSSDRPVFPSTGPEA